MEMSERTYQRVITLNEEAWKALQSIMKERGFPDKPVNESEVICEAILNMSESGLYPVEVKIKKEEKKK